MESNCRFYNLDDLFSLSGSVSHVLPPFGLCPGAFTIRSLATKRQSWSDDKLISQYAGCEFCSGARLLESLDIYDNVACTPLALATPVFPFCAGRTTF